MDIGKNMHLVSRYPQFYDNYTNKQTVIYSVVIDEKMYKARVLFDKCNVSPGALNLIYGIVQCKADTVGFRGEYVVPIVQPETILDPTKMVVWLNTSVQRFIHRIRTVHVSRIDAIFIRLRRGR